MLQGRGREAAPVLSIVVDLVVTVPDDDDGCCLMAVAVSVCSCVQ